MYSKVPLVEITAKKWIPECSFWLYGWETSVMLPLCFFAIIGVITLRAGYYREEEAFEDNFLQRHWSTFHQSSKKHIETHCWNTIICLDVSSKAVLLALVVTADIFTLYVCGGRMSFISGFCFLLNCKCLEPRLGSWLKFLVGKVSSVWQRQI